MGFVNKYPYTDFHELNLDYVLNKLTEFETEVKELEVKALEEANAYTDDKVSIFNNQIMSLRNEFESFKSEINASQASFETQIINMINLLDLRFANLVEVVNARIESAKEYTDLAILREHEKILEDVAKGFSGFKVINYFTGARTTIQDMFDYMANFHLNNSITVNQLIARDKTINELIALDATYTDIAVNGSTIIV